MKYLGLCCVVYANDHDDTFPANIADLVTVGVVNEEVLQRVLAPADSPAIQYRQPPIRAKDGGTLLILHEKHDQWPLSGIVAGFADGHCEVIIDQDRFDELLK